MAINKQEGKTFMFSHVWAFIDPAQQKINHTKTNLLQPNLLLPQKYKIIIKKVNEACNEEKEQNKVEEKKMLCNICRATLSWLPTENWKLIEHQTLDTKEL